MSAVQFLILLVIAAIAAGVQSLIVGWNSRAFAGAFVAYAIILVLPAIFLKLLGA